MFQGLCAVFLVALAGFPGLARAVPSALHGTDVTAYGVRYDVRLARGTMQGGSNTFSASGGSLFSSADAGKDVIIYYGGNGAFKNSVRGNVWTGCIARVDSPAVIAIGGWRGGLCAVSGSFPVVTDAYTILYGTDNTTALQKAIDNGGDGLLHLTGSVMIRDTLLFYQKTGRFEGLGSEGSLSGPTASGSSIIWAGRAGIPMVKLRNDMAMTLANLHFVGNGNPAHRPSALLDLVQPYTGGFRGINSFDSFINISNDPTGQLGRGPFADSGVYFEDATQNDIHRFNSLRLFNLATACVSQQNQQTVIVDFRDFQCSNTPVAWYEPHGGSVLFTGQFVATNVGQVFHLGRAARITVENLKAASSSPAQAGHSQLVYMESNPYGSFGGSLLVLHGSFELSSNIPDRPLLFLGHTLTPHAVVDTDNPTGDYVSLQNFAFVNSPVSPGRGEWFINLQPVRNLNQNYFRCDRCSGLTIQSLSKLRSGTNPYSITFVEINQLGFPPVKTRQILKAGAAFRVVPDPSRRF